MPYKSIARKVGRKIVRTTQRRGVEVYALAVFNNNGTGALYEWRRGVKMKKSKKKNKGFGLLEVLVAMGLLSFLMLGFASFIRVNLKLMGQERHRVEDILRRLADATSNIPKHCAADDVTCTCNAPSLCLHDNANGKTTQACEGDCQKVGGVWMKGTQTCSRGIYCIGG
jgi:prepilin-type N-terminal cleavage/methylation domain-containing protein